MTPFSRHALTAALLSSALFAQTQIAHANFDNFTFDDNISMGGPNLLVAIRTQVPATTVATRIEVWTGEGVGTNSLALWSHDPVNNRPLAQLGVGTWSMGQVNGWQGAPLTTPVVLLANDDVWVVWGPTNGAQSSVAGSGPGAQPYRGSFDGGNSWSGPFQSLQWKFRIWTGTPGHYEVYGTACPGSRGAGTPQLGWFGTPEIGFSFDIHLQRGLPGSFAFLLFGDSDSTFNGTPLPYSLTPLGAPNCSVLAAPVGNLLLPIDPANGQAGFTMSIPVLPAAIGYRMFHQWLCLDPAANPLGLTTSNAGAATIGG
ncbi:MAG: hypothetical protein JNK49_12845 [Planctomycetes bacterium]|nr:hypothetical protein [Planctomycetota bacterium]